MGGQVNRQDAVDLLHEYTKGEPLRKHALAVEAAMRAYARKYGQDEEIWGMVGLLHDFDYEAHPTMEEHPFVGAAIMRERGWPEEIVEGVLAHADYTGVERDTPLKKTIFAVDELTGFITACALVYGRDLNNVTPERVRKKLKDKSFARQVNRQDILTSFEELDADPDEHIQFVIDAMKPLAGELGLAKSG
jgi:putative nucleotidyltransferase with HDIG domain